MIPASIRNRNPGATYPGPSAKKFGSTSFETLKSKDGTHKIATFPTEVHGAAALFHLLHEGREPVTRKLRYRDRPLRDALKTWCGAYYLPTYIKVVTTHCSIAADDVLTSELLKDPEQAIPFAKAMALQEAGQAFPLEDTGWREAHALAFSNAVAPGWTPTNDVPTRNPEDKIEKTLKRWAAPVVAGGAAIGEVAKDGVPPVAEVATKSLENIDAWKGLGKKVWSLGGELAIVPWWAVAGGVLGLGVLAFLKLRERNG